MRFNQRYTKPHTHLTRTTDYAQAWCHSSEVSVALRAEAFLAGGLTLKHNIWYNIKKKLGSTVYHTAVAETVLRQKKHDGNFPVDANRTPVRSRIIHQDMRMHEHTSRYRFLQYLVPATWHLVAYAGNLPQRGKWGGKRRKQMTITAGSATPHSPNLLSIGYHRACVWPKRGARSCTSAAAAAAAAATAAATARCWCCWCGGENVCIVPPYHRRFYSRAGILLRGTILNRTKYCW